MGFRRGAWRWVLLLAAGCLSVAHAEPDADRLGAAAGYPLGTAFTWYQNPHRVGAWSAMHRVPGLRSRRVDPSTEPVALPVLTPAPELRYRFRNLGYTLPEYLERQRVTGLLVLRNGQVVAEHYRYGRGPDARFLSFSMAKSVTSLLVGIAQVRGHIASLDDPAGQYVRGLRGTPYGDTTVRQLLRMSSGLTFTERYDGNDDIARMSAAFGGSPVGTMEVLPFVRDRHSPSGEVFRYASAETDVLGRVLAGATGRDLADLTREWLWQPLGAQDEAWWRVGRDGQEGAHAFFSASLRDWARLGLLLAQEGRAGGREVVPAAYLLDATDATRQPAAFRPGRATPYFGYGYQFWLMPMRERTFVMMGVHGQALYVQPATGIVMVHTAVWEHASGTQDPLPGQERDALWRGVLQSLGGRTD